MGNKLSLNGDDWGLTGWFPNQWRKKISMELGRELLPVVPDLPAAVPGSVQRDLMAGGWLADSNMGLRSLDGEWVSHREWMLTKRVVIDPAWVGDRVELVFEGLDYAGEIYWDGKLLSRFEGMFKPVLLDISGRLSNSKDKTYELVVVFYAGQEVPAQVGYSHTIDKLKSRFNYGWDWCPRVVPVGIWRDVYVKTYSSAVIRDYYPQALVDTTGGGGSFVVKVEAEVYSRGNFTFC